MRGICAALHTLSIALKTGMCPHFLRVISGPMAMRIFASLIVFAAAVFGAWFFLRTPELASKDISAALEDVQARLGLGKSDNGNGNGDVDTAPTDPNTPRVVGTERGSSLKVGIQSIEPKDEAHVMLYVRVLHAPEGWGDPNVPLYLTHGTDRYDAVSRTDYAVRSDGAVAPLGAAFAIPRDVLDFTMVLEGRMKLLVYIQGSVQGVIEPS